jgi:hypothetical protein
VTAAALVARRLSLSELRFRAGTGDSLLGERVSLTGQVTAVRGGVVVLTRWVPGCCSAEDPVDVDVLADEPAALPGTWWEVEGSWVPGTGVEHGSTPQVEAAVLRPVEEPPDRRDG